MVIRITLIILIGLACWQLTGCGSLLSQRIGQPANAAPGEVSFKLAGANGAAILVPVQINGQGPYNFVLDTGATFTCVDQKLADQLKLPASHSLAGFGIGVRTTGEVNLIEISSIKVGTASASDLPACTLDLKQMQAVGDDIKGLLGLNFLKSYKIAIDFDRKVLTLQKR